MISFVTSPVNLVNIQLIFPSPSVQEVAVTEMAYFFCRLSSNCKSAYKFCWQISTTAGQNLHKIEAIDSDLPVQPLTEV
jgi:hypothetical protein